MAENPKDPTGTSNAAKAADALENTLNLFHFDPKEADRDYQAEFLAAANAGDTRSVYNALNSKIDINKPDKDTGLTALHIAIGRNAFSAVELLIKNGAAFVPDKLGRMPSVIAAECEVDERLCDLIVEAEAKANSKVK